MLQSMSSLIPLLWVLLAGLLSYGVAFVLCEALLRRRWRRNVIEPLSAMLTELRELHEATPGALQAAKLRNASEAETARQAEKPMLWGMRPPNCIKPDEPADAFRREWDRYVAERRSADAAETASDKAVQAALAQGEQDIAAGRGHDLDDVSRGCSHRGAAELDTADATSDGDTSVTVSPAQSTDVKPHPRGFDLDEELASIVGGIPSESNPTDAALPEFRRLPLREGSPAFRELLRDWSARGGFFERMHAAKQPVCVRVEYASLDGPLVINSLRLWPERLCQPVSFRLSPAGRIYANYVDRSTYRPCIGEGTAKRLVSWAEFDPNGLTAPPAQQAV